MFLLGKTVKYTLLSSISCNCESTIVSIRISIYKNQVIFSEKIELQHYDSVCSFKYGWL